MSVIRTVRSTRGGRCMGACDMGAGHGQGGRSPAAVAVSGRSGGRRGSRGDTSGSRRSSSHGGSRGFRIKGATQKVWNRHATGQPISHNPVSGQPWAGWARTVRSRMREQGKSARDGASRAAGGGSRAI